MIEQGTDEWRSERAGKITASRFADAIDLTQPEPGAVYKTGPKKGQPKLPVSTAAREKYMREVVAEILSGKPKHEIGSQSLRHGREVEAYALEAYELETGNVTHEIGFITHPRFSFIGCSPDRLIGDDGGYESKCPYDEQVHILTMLEGMPADHIAQVQGCMFVTGRQWWDFVSYDPRQAEPYRLYVQRIDRDDAYIEKLEFGLCHFWNNVDEMVKRLRSRAA